MPKSKNGFFFSLFLAGGLLAGCSVDFKPKNSDANNLGGGPGGDPVPSSFKPVSVFVAYGGVRVHSLDGGKTWVGEYDSTDNNDCWSYRDLAYGNGKFMATSWTGGFNRISTSPDGVHWRHAENQFWTNTIAYGHGVFLMQDGYSPDGYSFVARPQTIDASIGTHTMIRFDRAWNRFYATGDAAGLAYSDDGITFTTVLTGGTRITQFAGDNNGNVVGINQNRLVHSGNGGGAWNDFRTLSSVPGGAMATESSLYSLGFDGTKFNITGTSTVYTSIDGYTWSATASPGFSLLLGDTGFNLLFGLRGITNWTDPANFFYSAGGSTWTHAESISFNPPIQYGNITYYVTGQAYGLPSADPNGPRPSSMPASIQLSKDQLRSTVCSIPFDRQ